MGVRIHRNAHLIEFGDLTYNLHWFWVFLASLMGIKEISADMRHTPDSLDRGLFELIVALSW